MGQLASASQAFGVKVHAEERYYYDRMAFVQQLTS